jgi:serine/threonine protein phosphatase 1
MRTLAIGDIHGCLFALDCLLDQVQPQAEEQLIFLGDYVDRGPDSRGVIERLLWLREQHPRSIFLRGNHEIMMVTAKRHPQTQREWLSVGGKAALQSYAGDRLIGRLEDVPDSHWAFLEQGLSDWFETASHIFVHANLDPTQPLDRQSEDWLFWNFLTGPIRHCSGKTVIVGHTVQRDGWPVDYGDTIAIDTGLYRGGWLTCLDVVTGQFWQTNLSGQSRQGSLRRP